MNRPCPAVASLLFFCSLSVVPAQEWYESGPAGTSGIPVADGPGETGWKLSIAREGDTEIRTLYADGALHSSVRLVRVKGRLLSREERSAEGDLLSRVEYSYDVAGNPMASYIESGGTESRLLGVESNTGIHADGVVNRHQTGGAGDWVITDFDSGGLPVRQVSLVDGTAVREGVWKRTDEGIPVEFRLREGDSTQLNIYDAQGRLIREETRRDGHVILTRHYTWSQTDLVRVEERGEGRLSVRQIEWDGDRISRETRLIDGVMESETLWTSPEERTETFYRDGKAVVRVYWSGERRQKEEFLREGVVIRVQQSD